MVSFIFLSIKLILLKQLHFSVLIEKQYLTIISFRNIINASLINTNTTLGGVDRIVQIDECLALKRKHNRGRFKPEIWLFEGIDILTQKAFLLLFPIENGKHYFQYFLIK